jgi:hypothetical protein
VRIPGVRGSGGIGSASTWDRASGVTRLPDGTNSGRRGRISSHARASDGARPSSVTGCGRRGRLMSWDRTLTETTGEARPPTGMGCRPTEPAWSPTGRAGTRVAPTAPRSAGVTAGRIRSIGRAHQKSIAGRSVPRCRRGDLGRRCPTAAVREPLGKDSASFPIREASVGRRRTCRKTATMTR